MMNVAIVGAGYAGVACALRLSHRARRSGLPVRIRLISDRPQLVERIRLHQLAAGQRLRERPLAQLLRDSGVEIVAGKAEAIDLSSGSVTVAGQSYPWDRLVLAMGSRTDLTRVTGAAEHASAVEPETAAHLTARLQALPPGARVVVVGGGLTGIETAAEIAESHPRLDVRLLAAGRIADDFGIAARRCILTTLALKLHVGIIEGRTVSAVHPRQLETDDKPIPFDLCIWTAGFRAAMLPGCAGIRTDDAGQVLVDPMLRSVSHPRVFVAGDAGTPVLPPGQPLPMGCKTAEPMGAHVGDNVARDLAGTAMQPFDYALLFFCVSLGRRHGLIQWADAQGRLTGRILKGLFAAYFKELICRSTLWALQLERMGLPAVVWKRTGRAPRQMPILERSHGER